MKINNKYFLYVIIKTIYKNIKKFLFSANNFKKKSLFTQNTRKDIFITKNVSYFLIKNAAVPFLEQPLFFICICYLRCPPPPPELELPPPLELEPPPELLLLPPLEPPLECPPPPELELLPEYPPELLPELELELELLPELLLEFELPLE